MSDEHKYLAPLENKKLLCPLCRSELAITGQARLETILEHVECSEEISLKNKYECSNEDCPTRNVVFWNQDGELYTHEYVAYKSLKFIDDNDAPFGSHQREFNVTCYKHDEDYDLYVGRKWRWQITFTYTANENGEILSRKRHLKFWKRDKSGMEIHHIPGIHMFIYTIKSFRKHLDFYEINHPAIQRDLVLHEWQKEDWWRRYAHPIKKWLYNRKLEQENGAGLDR